jgi:ribonuclease P protein component
MHSPNNTGERFFRNQRIRLSADFERFRAREALVHRSEVFILKMLDGRHGVSRLGVIVPKKIGNAVARNRMRRIFREIFRKKLQRCGAAKDYLFVVKKRSSYQKIEVELLDAANVLHKRTPVECHGW